MDFYFITLALLFTLSNVFWAIVVFKLMNRLMSRNYHEFKVAETIGDKGIKKTKTQNLEDLQQEMQEYQLAMQSMSELAR